MRKKLTLLIVAVLCILVLAGCECRHKWQPATCEAPKTCSKCDAVEGAALGHAWNDATCTAGKTCSSCGLISGEALGHDWMNAVCGTGKMCAACGQTEGEAREHTWVDANYQQPKTCSFCGAEEGAPKVGTFEEKGMTAEVTATGKRYPVEAAGLTFDVCVKSWEDVETSEIYVADDGYAWKRLSLLIAVDGGQEEGAGETQNEVLYMNYTDYYDPVSFYSSMQAADESAPGVTSFVVNHQGKDYDQCIMVYETGTAYQANDPNQTWVFEMSTSYRLPEGYDGLVLCLGDAVRLANEYQGDYEKLYADEDTVFLRLN